MPSYKAFVDESINEDPSIYVMSCVLVEGSLVEKFRTTWTESLRACPSVKNFKYSDFRNKRNSFRLMSDEERYEKFDLFVRCIERFSVASVSCWIDHNVLGNKLRYENLPSYARRPYFFLLYGLTLQLRKIQEELGLSGKIDLIFDHQVMEEHSIKAEWHDFVENFDENKLTFDLLTLFTSDHDEVLLQAADLEAGSVRHQLVNRRQGVAPPFFPRADELRAMPRFIVDWPDAGIDRIVRRLMAPVFILSGQWGHVRFSVKRELDF